ncbi:GNAT family N-acetyltransferase [Corynebacterium aurimucosum]|uniref:GNAT family N-acetyltransferase n=1 Tax=Corynebacterium aurimucosum TaxID=169292 RepID=UPI001D0D5441|nr:N-acetyltransferase [Corynebacterium aurimucosum]
MVALRPETYGDIEPINRVIEVAFRSVKQSDHTEQLIVARLRDNNALNVSLVAEVNNQVVGHIAASPVTFGSTEGWLGIGPVSVLTDQQGIGIGSALIEAALNELKKAGAAGAVVLGEPDYYCRFGFKQVAGVHFPGVPAEYFTVLPFGQETSEGLFAIITRLASVKDTR